MKEEVKLVSSIDIALAVNRRHGNILQAIRKDKVQYEVSFKSNPNANGKSEPIYWVSSDYSEDRFTNNFNSRVYAERENGALCAIEQLLNISLERQYRVGKYRIDGYCIETNTAYEIDEEQHRTPSAIDKDRARQAFIENELGCKFVRIKV